MSKKDINKKHWLHERINESKIIMVIIVPVYFFTSIFIEKILPNNFFSDSMTIRSLIGSNNIIFNPSDSYASTASFYKLIGFRPNTPHFFESLLSTVILSFFLYLLVRKEHFLVLSLTNFATLCITILFYLCFFSVISKDLIAFTLILIAFYFYRSPQFFVLFLSSIIIYGLLFRIYWLLIIPLVFVIYYLMNGQHYIFIIIYIMIFVVIISYIYYRLNGTYISFLRYETHTVLSANTNINNLFPGTNLFYDVLNSLNTFGNLIIPLDGLGSSAEIAYYVWTYYVLYLCFDSIKHDNNHNNNLVVACFVSFLVIQGLFEPDMGSALRHQLIFSIFIINVFNNRKVYRNLKVNNL